MSVEAEKSLSKRESGRESGLKPFRVSLVPDQVIQLMGSGGAEFVRLVNLWVYPDLSISSTKKPKI